MTWLYSITNSMDLSLSKCQEIVKDRGTWNAAVHGVAKSRTWLSDWITTIIDLMIIKTYCWLYMRVLVTWCLTGTWCVSNSGDELQWPIEVFVWSCVYQVLSQWGETGWMWVFLPLVDMSGYQLMMLAPVKQWNRCMLIQILFSIDFCIYLFS